jgi:hypothetical protein
LGTTDIGKDNAFTVQAFNIAIQNNKVHLDEKVLFSWMKAQWLIQELSMT